MIWMNDLWSLDLKTHLWLQIQPSTETKPRPRDGHIAVTDGTGLYVHSGWIGQKRILNALNIFENKDSTNNLQAGLIFLSQLDETHFTDDLWMFDMGIIYFIIVLFKHFFIYFYYYFVIF